MAELREIPFLFVRKLQCIRERWFRDLGAIGCTDVSLP